MADRKFRQEEQDYEKQRKIAELNGFRQDTRERKVYAKRFFYMACSWIVFISVLLLFQGTGKFGYLGYFNLSENVVLAAIGATTANIIGILLVVANYLFPKRDK